MAKKKVKSKGGRPTKFAAAMLRQVERLCLLGATDEELADFFDIATSTLYEWKKKPKFSEAIKRGKEMADAAVADALFRRALGYSHKAVKIFQYEGKPVSVPFTEHYPPDPVSCIFWLKNRQREKWRDKVDVGVTDEWGKVIQAAEERLATMRKKPPEDNENPSVH